jgi:hypothetical protein
VNYGLGRIPSPKDERDYSLADVAGYLGAAVVPKHRLWSSARVLNQHTTNHCVGYGCAAWGIALPVYDPWHDIDGDNLYYAAKIIDGEPGAEDGSCVRSGLQALQQIGRVKSYFWLTNVGEAPNMDALVQFLLTQGSVIAGTDWTQDMFTPDARGVIHPTGAVRGGHCYLVRGVDTRTELARIRNSWGTGWGKPRGDASIALADLETLLQGTGEAAAAIEMPLAA